MGSWHLTRAAVCLLVNTLEENRFKIQKQQSTVWILAMKSSEPVSLISARGSWEHLPRVSEVAVGTSNGKAESWLP